MSDETLEQLSQKSKTYYESQEWQQAANCLVEARERFPQQEGEKLVQDTDGSIKVEYIEIQKGVEHTLRRAVVDNEEVEEEE